MYLYLFNTHTSLFYRTHLFRTVCLPILDTFPMSFNGSNHITEMF